MKKLLSIVLTIALILSAAPAVFAAEETAEITGTEPQYIRLYSGIFAQDDTIYLTDLNCKVIWELENGKTSLWCGEISHQDALGEYVGGYIDSTFKDSRFKEPWDITGFFNGYAVSDPGNGKLRYLADGKVMTINVSVSLDRPTGLACDDKGNLYVSDTGNNRVLKITTSGDVSTVSAGLEDPTGLCWKNGTLYICESGKNRIMAIKNGILSVTAGKDMKDGDTYTGGYVNGPVEKALFSRPEGVAVTDDGTIYVADTGNKAVRMIKDGRVSTVAENNGTPSSPAAPRSISLSKDTIYVTDALTGALLTYPAGTKTFTDVAEGDWFRDSVINAASCGLISGYTDGSFKPQANLNRAQFMAMLANLKRQMDGQTVINGNAEIGDIDGTEWYSDCMKWAVDNSYIAGTVRDSVTYAMPTKEITREQLVTILYNFAEAHKSAVPEVKEVSLDSFADLAENKAEIAEYAVIPMEWALNTGLVGGFADGTLRPAAAVTRAQAATILYNFLIALGY